METLEEPTIDEEKEYPEKFFEITESDIKAFQIKKAEEKRKLESKKTMGKR